jgi:hypothetical protein
MSRRREFGKHCLVEFEDGNPWRFRYPGPAGGSFRRGRRDCKAARAVARSLATPRIGA